MLDLRDIAHALGGEIRGAEVLCPGPGHSKRDRSMSVRISATAPDGFICHSFAGDSWRDCQSHVRRALGIAPDIGRRDDRRPAPNIAKHADADGHNDGRTRGALALWQESSPEFSRAACAYFERERRLSLPDDRGEVIRWNDRLHCIIGLFRNLHTYEPQAVTRIFIDADGRKLERKFLSPTRDAAIMLDAPEDVTYGLHVAEGLETALAARQMGFRPCWALGSAGAIARLPVLAGVDALTVCAELDDGGANDRAVAEVAACWRATGREVWIIEPTIGDDLNSIFQNMR